jgi:hypothetical protein
MSAKLEPYIPDDKEYEWPADTFSDEADDIRAEDLKRMEYSPHITKLGLQFCRGFTPDILPTVARNYPNLCELIIFCNYIGSKRKDDWQHADLECLPDTLEVLVLDCCQSYVDLHDLTRFKNLRTTILNCPLKNADAPRPSGWVLITNPYRSADFPSDAVGCPSLPIQHRVRALGRPFALKFRHGMRVWEAPTGATSGTTLPASPPPSTQTPPGEPR